MREESTSEYFGTGWRRVDAASTRVVDTHCHSFPPLGRSAGWDPQVHTRLVQYHMRDFRDIWRKTDGARLDATLLDYPSDDIHEMPDLGFRLTEFGRVEFSRDGVDYYMQAYPPDLTNVGRAGRANGCRDGHRGRRRRRAPERPRLRRPQRVLRQAHQRASGQVRPAGPGARVGGRPRRGAGARGKGRAGVRLQGRLLQRGAAGHGRVRGPAAGRQVHRPVGPGTETGRPGLVVSRRAQARPQDGLYGAARRADALVRRQPRHTKPDHSRAGAGDHLPRSRNTRRAYLSAQAPERLRGVPKPRQVAGVPVPGGAGVRQADVRRGRG